MDLVLWAPVAAMLPTRSWAKSAVVALSAGRGHGDIPVEADPSVRETGQQRSVFLATVITRSGLVSVLQAITS